MSIAEPVSVPSHWDWLAPIYHALLILIVFLLVGLMSFAAVRQLDCRNEETFLTSEAGAFLTDEQGRLLVTGQTQKTMSASAILKLQPPEGVHAKI